MMRFVVEQESHGDGVLTVVDKNHLEEAVGYGYFMITYALGALLIVYGSAGYIYGAVLACPFAANIF